MPRLTAECVGLKTSSGTAHCVNALPRFEIVCPAQNLQKSRLRRVDCVSLLVGATVMRLLSGSRADLRAARATATPARDDPTSARRAAVGAARRDRGGESGGRARPAPR